MVISACGLFWPQNFSVPLRLCSFAVLRKKVIHSRDDFLCGRKTPLTAVFPIPHLISISSSFPLWPSVGSVFLCVHRRFFVRPQNPALAVFPISPSYILQFFVSFVAFCRICVHLRPSTIFCAPTKSRSSSFSDLPILYSSVLRFLCCLL